MSDNLMEKVSAFGERIKTGGAEVGRKMSASMSSMSFKMKEIFIGQSHADKLVDDATSDTLGEPDWVLNMEICDSMNHGRVNSVELICSIKKRITIDNPRVQYFALVLLETCVKNCDNSFAEVAAERVLDEMVKLIDEPATIINNRNKALMLIESWGESANELRFLPVYEETYRSLKSRGIRFPGRDDESLAPIFTPPRSVSAPEVPLESFTPQQIQETFDVARNSIELLTTVLSSSSHEDVLKDELTTTLTDQCRTSQFAIQRIIETAGDNDSLLFEALNMNDEIQKVLSKYDEMRKPSLVAQSNVEPAKISVAMEPYSPVHANEEALIRKPTSSRGVSRQENNNDIGAGLDSLVIGEQNAARTSEAARDQKMKQPVSSNDIDLITF